MTERGTERAARVADVMQTLARILVLVIIIPTAILLAVYYLLMGLIPDNLIRMMFSLTFGLGIAGGFVTRMERPLLGSSIVTLAAIFGAVSLAIFWSSLFSSIAVLHVYLIVLLGILSYLHRVHVIPPWRWIKIRSLLGISISASAPLASIILFQGMGLQAPHIISISMLILWVYTAGGQYYLRALRLGPASALFLSLSVSFLVLQYHLDTCPASDILLSMSVAFLGFGGGLFVVSQILRFIQKSISLRTISSRERKHREGILDNYPEQGDELPDAFPEWIIRSKHAQAISGIAMLAIAAGIPVYFLWMAQSTTWGVEPSFLNLFVPLAFLAFLLTLIPSPVLFRLGGIMQRSTESNIVKGIGLLMVLDASLASYIWTQFWFFSLMQSITFSFILLITGLTGVFERIRALWKRVGYELLYQIKKLRHWISGHLVHTGVAVDSVITLFVMSFLYPFLYPLPNMIAPLLLLSVVLFTLIAMAGVAALRMLPKRIQFASIGWSILLISGSLLTYWYLTYIVNMELMPCLAYSSLWFIGMAALQKANLSRPLVSIPVAFGVLGTLYHLVPLEYNYSSITYPWITITSTILLLGLVLHKEYIRFLGASYRLLAATGRRIYNVISRAAHVIISVLTRFATAARRVLVRVGGFIYRGAVFIGLQLLRFVLAVYTIIIVIAIAHFGYNVVFITGTYEPWFLFSSLSLVFFIALSPSLYFRERHKTPLLKIVIIGIGLTLGGFVFGLISSLHFWLRIPLSIASVLAFWTLTRKGLPEKSRDVLPVATWLAVLSAISLMTWLTSFEASLVVASITTAFITGVGFLPIRIQTKLARVSSLLYLVLSVPSGAAMAFMYTSDYVLSLLVIAALPAAVLYRQYSSGLEFLAGKLAAGFRILASALLHALRIIAQRLSIAVRYILIVLAANIIPATGVFSIAISFVIMQALPQYVQVWFLGVTTRLLVFILLTMILWLPALLIRHRDFPLLLSGVLITIAGSMGALSLSFLLPLGFLRAFLLSIALTSFILALSTPGIERIGSRKAPSSVSFSALLLFCLDLLSLDFPLTLGILAFSFAVLSAPFLSRINQFRVVYPIATASSIALVFYYFVLPITDLWLTISLCVAFEALLLSIPNEIRSWQLWWLLSISIGYAIFSIMNTAPYLGAFIAILISTELIHLTPDIEYRFTEYGEALSVMRGFLLTASAGLILSPILSVELVAEICLTVFLIVFSASIWNGASAKSRTIFLDATGVSLSLLSFTFLSALLEVHWLLVLYISIPPIFAALIYASTSGVAQSHHWTALKGVAVLSISLAWFSVYQTVESILLGLPTGLFIAIALSYWNPWGGSVQGKGPSPLVGAFILLIESIWVFYSVVIFSLSGSLILLGASLLPIILLGFPLRNMISWMQFELIWDAISASIAVSTGSILSGWDIASLTFPPNLALLLGWSLSLYSIFSLSVTHLSEKRQNLQTEEKVSHLTWTPAILGWTILGYAYSAIFELIPSFQLGVSWLSFCISSLIFVTLHPNPSSNLKIAINMLVSTALAYFTWITFSWVDSLYSFIFSVGVWYLFGLPVLAAPTYSLFRRAYAFITTHSENIALGLPVIIGLWFGATFLLDTTCPAILGIGVRNCFQALAIGALTVGGLYLLEGMTLNGNLSSRVKQPSVTILGRGVFVLLLAIYLPEVFVAFDLVLYYLAGSAAVSFFVMFFLNLILGFREAMRRSLMIAGVLLLPSLMVGLMIFNAFPLLESILLASFASFLVESPLFEVQIRRFFGALRNVATLVSNALRKLGHAIKQFFLRFGYINWIVFSAGFTICLSWLSYPFFSEFLNMNPLSFAYVIPSIGIPILVLGFLLLSISIIRRTVRSSFGSASFMIALFGAATTGTSWLFDHGFMLESTAVGVILVCLSILIFMRERHIMGRWVSAIWSPIPLSLGVLIFSFIYPVGSPIELLPLALSVSAMIGLFLLLLSAYSRLMPNRVKTPLWVMTGASSAIATYMVSVEASFPVLASIYLAVFVMSWVMFPLTHRQYRHLFNAPLFFALTGFAFTFVFGEYYQGLLLALASFLLFIVLFVKEREPRNPKLAYLRLFMLMVLLAFIAVFGITMLGVLMT
ncbi:MAG: hypothetical protein ACFFEF_03330 [Candidatus Thorarchaeota archaeon]